MGSAENQRSCVLIVPEMQTLLNFPGAVERITTQDKAFTAEIFSILKRNFKFSTGKIERSSTRGMKKTLLQTFDALGFGSLRLDRMGRQPRELVPCPLREPGLCGAQRQGLPGVHPHDFLVGEGVGRPCRFRKQVGPPNGNAACGRHHPLKIPG
ncbi:MAG TPA: hypothetical protein ACFCUC_17885 [Desulfobacterales bacterium]